MSCPEKQVSGRRVAPLPGGRPATPQAQTLAQAQEQEQPDEIANQFHENHYTSDRPGYIFADERFSSKSGSRPRSANTNYYGITMNGAKEFIAANPFIMDNYVEENVGIDTLELWLKQKKAALDRKSFLELDELQKQDTATLNRFQYVNVQKIQETLSHEVFDVHDFTPFLYEVAGSIASAVGAEDFSLYTIEAGSKEITLHQPAFLETDRERLCWPVSEGTTVSAYVGLTKKTLLIADLQNDERFPQGVGLDSVKINSVLCVPFIQANGDLLGIIELVRTLGSPGFTIENQQTATTIVCWTGLAIQNIQACKALSKQQELNDFLLEASQIVLDDKEGSDTLINHIMSYTKNLVQADRCSFFLIDPSTDQLFCSLFDEGQVDQHGRPLFVKKNELRFSMNTGIAGFVARTGQLVNSSNPYEDTRFNRELDLLTGFTTNSILCMPILSNNKVVGVVQMLNKRGGTAFTNTDESTFKSFAVYCSLALLYSKLSQTMYEAKNRLEVQEEKIRYHLHPPEESYKNLLASPLPKKNPKGFFRYEFYCMPHMEKLPKLFISMVHTLFGPDCFDLSKLCRFILTVKQGYRDVPYHNFKHAFTVTHCMFRFLHENPTTFPLMERKALIFACICHDLDHQGYNNMFMKTMKTPLSVLYAESIMESHHYQETLFILQGLCRLSLEPV
ncbi:PREDICTED: cAMP and cAMP-inhibited cGMP 3',5'-cyclic phosphodiesterase 10A-like [Priapulus caudatus]|uniref:Phosphodiesterase n=1 Tax=Priapulus caudatus TaxID=37621 RepID=A0ABM1EQF9_PRICU|nr:PREDICTED: cAMP and cAMP-inhibited cGMP 3',5'-cyclic phosphodiesterase 10A-like [Priapulus caudatus]